MSLSSRRITVTVFFLAICGCSNIPPPPVLSPHEQLTVDTVKVKELLHKFERHVRFPKMISVEQYLAGVARQITRENATLKSEKVTVKIHDDHSAELKRFFSFPGIVISVPQSFLHSVKFENELAAAVSLELAQIHRRDLATEMDKNENPILFGPLSIFRFPQKARGDAIELGTQMMYEAGYDPRGMAAVFQKYAHYYVDTASPTGQKEAAYYVKEAQKAKNDSIPSRLPIVRSNDFLRMKKVLKEST